MSDLLRVGLVDPSGGRQLGRDGPLADEPLGVAREGRLEHAGAGVSTYWYLTAAPELLALVADRLDPVLEGLA